MTDAPLTPTAADVCAGGELAERLRGAWALSRAAAWFGPLDVVLRDLGLVLVASGLGWAALRLLLEHAYVAVVALGLACLLGSVAVCPGGLLRSLPPYVQDFLVRKTPFDLLYDDSRLRNFLRRWGRMQLLALRGAASEREISKIVEDLDPAFVDTVLGKTFLQIVPAPVRRLLVPTAPVFGDEALEEHNRRSAAHARHLHGVGVQGRWTPAEIARLLREKDQARGRRITEPEIGIVALRVLALGPVLRSWGNILARGAQTTVALLSVGWAGCAVLLRYRLGFSGALGSIPGLPSAASSSQVSFVAKAACVASALSLVSAGAAVVITAYSQRFASAWEGALSERAAQRMCSACSSWGSDAASADCAHTDTEPEHEESAEVDGS